MMKKTLLSLVVMTIAVMSFGQKISKATLNYRVGIATSLPVDVHGTDPRVGIGSTFLEAACSPHKSKKYAYTVSAGYFRIVSGQNTPSYSQIPVLVGARYTVNPSMYFGAAVGTSFNTKKAQGDPDFAFSPYIGFQSRRISVDARYFNFWKQAGSSLRSVGLVFSYTL